MGKSNKADSHDACANSTIFWITVPCLVCFVAYLLQPLIFRPSRHLWFGDPEGMSKAKSIDWKILVTSVAVAYTGESNHQEEEEVRNLVVREASKLRQPVILKDSPVNEWPAIKLWADDAYLASKIPKLEGVKQQSSKLFVYHTGRHYTKYSGFGDTVHKYPYGTASEVSVEDFLTRELNMQYSQRLGLEETNDFGKNEILPLDGDALPRKFLRVDNTPEAHNVFWLGQPNTTTSVHYDLHHNFVTQVRGTRRFILYPPSASASLVPHPYHHPRYRQSQLYYVETGASSFWGDIAREPVVADLEPGDLLYVPPFWWHRVESNSKGPSIQVNTWSTSDEISAFNGLVTSKPPKWILKLWGSKRVVPFAKQYVLDVVTEVQKLFPSHFNAKGGPEEFIGEIVQTKYLSKGLTPRLIDLEPYFECADWKESSCPKKSTIIQSDRGKLKQAAQSLADKFYSTIYANVTNPSDLDPQVADHYAGVVRTTLSDFVENQLFTLLASKEQHGSVCSIMRCMALYAS
ncbi:hypothetical protein TrST_g10392 [Triparma strigata]|uniref:JmjC domain-containing protein n=1 Tax=Triparma strigata TaxID=1606541 RepID=A0A9W7C3T0_9STRA|nr:hypothetical protein TrST_g10392 [Triparma strigata]